MNGALEVYQYSPYFKNRTEEIPNKWLAFLVFPQWEPTGSQLSRSRRKIKLEKIFCLCGQIIAFPQLIRWVGSPITFQNNHLICPRAVAGEPLRAHWISGDCLWGYWKEKMCHHSHRRRKMDGGGTELINASPSKKSHRDPKICPSNCWIWVLPMPFWHGLVQPPRALCPEGTGQSFMPPWWCFLLNFPCCLDFHFISVLLLFFSLHRDPVRHSFCVLFDCLLERRRLIFHQM